MIEKSSINLLIVDDHPLVRDGLKARLESISHFNVIGEAGNSEDALQVLANSPIDLILMDINLGNSSGLVLTTRICKDYSKVAIIMLSMHEKSEYVTQAVQAGARDRKSVV